MIRTETNAVAVEREIREFCTRKWKRYGDRLNERKRRFKNNSELCVSDVWDGASCQGDSKNGFRGISMSTFMLFSRYF